MVRSRRLSDRLVDGALCAILALLGLSCLLPFIHVLANSLSDPSASAASRVGLWPVGFTLSNYAFLLEDRVFLRSFGISAARVASGVSLSVLVTVLTAYPLSREHIHMPGRTLYKVLLLVGLLFNAGLIPLYLAIRNLGLYNNFLVLILPPALGIFGIIVMVDFFRSIPLEFEEAAVLDGASDLHVLFLVFVPLSMPAIAMIALFSAVTHWNAWFDGVLYMARSENWPLQSYLYSLVTTRMAVWQTGIPNLPGAMIVVAILPIALVYPLLQRYFISGMMFGSIKG
jgi:ABC-type glycerol-3-phosphate transport system permease component